MDRFPQMLYRAPGPLLLDNGSFDTLVVDSEEALEAALAAGWHETSPAAKEAHEQALAAAAAPPAAPEEPVSEEPMSRAELEQAAAELGLKFDGRIGDKKLAALVAEKLKG